MPYYRSGVLGTASSPAAYGAAIALLYDFLTGHGARVRYYGPDSLQSIDLQRSGGVRNVPRTIKANCEAGATSGRINVGTGEAAQNLLGDIWRSPTGAQVGGYNGTWTTNGGTVDIDITNDAGLHSFAYHVPSNRQFPTGPFSTIFQHFSFKAPNPCAGPG